MFQSGFGYKKYFILQSVTANMSENDKVYRTNWNKSGHLISVFILRCSILDYAFLWVGAWSSFSCGWRGNGSNRQVIHDSDLCWISLLVCVCASLPPAMSETDRQTVDQHKDV